MKNQVICFLKQFYVVPRYSGKYKIMYISYSKTTAPKLPRRTMSEIIGIVVDTFTKLPFKLSER